MRGYTTFGRIYHKRLIDLGLNNKEFAAKLGISASALTHYTTGFRAIHLDLLFRIVKELKLEEPEANKLIEAAHKAPNKVLVIGLTESEALIVTKYIQLIRKQGE